MINNIMALGACFETLFRRLRRRYLGIALCEPGLKYSGRDVICGSIQKANGCLSLSHKQEVCRIFETEDQSTTKPRTLLRDQRREKPEVPVYRNGEVGCKGV